MPYVSTEGRTPETSLHDALFLGLAPDGGLFMPTPLPILAGEDLDSLVGMDWQETASVLAQRFLAEAIDPETIHRLVRDAFDFPIPLTRLTDRIHLLDLSQGPTLAFKDIGARFMARLMAHLQGGEEEPLTILTATSGDTGGAVAHAFLGLPGVRVVVLFPDGKVSPRQERQFSTLGENVQALAVQGDFDDCQRMAKSSFRDPGLRDALSLTSANSINVGRFLPQSFYYVYARARLMAPLQAPGAGSGAGGREGGPHTPPPLLFSVPSGNFGNLAAGLLAKAMGLPGVRFLAATNANDAVPDYLATGSYRPRPSRRTLSTAMDVGDPSNLARIRHLYAGDLTRLREDLTARSVSDEETRTTIRRVYDRTGVVLDPHTAVGFHALEQELKGDANATGVLLATASPSKFAEVVEPTVGKELPIPPQLARGLTRERRVTLMAPDPGALKTFLLTEINRG